VAGRFAANWPRTAAAATALLGARFGLIVVLLHVPLVFVVEVYARGCIGRQ
jgi:hypothetical protein